MTYEHLIPQFLEAMEDIGRYGEQKYGAESFRQRSKRNDRTRINRTEPIENMTHANEHFRMAINGEIHDHFKTRKHQLAAVAFNAMMEFYFAGLETESSA